MVPILAAEDAVLHECLHVMCWQAFTTVKKLLDLGILLTRYPALDWGVFWRTAADARCRTMAWAALKLVDRLLGIQAPMPDDFVPGRVQQAAIAGVPLVSLWGPPGRAEQDVWQHLCVESRSYKVRAVLRRAVLRPWNWRRLAQVGWSGLRLALGPEGWAARRQGPRPSSQ